MNAKTLSVITGLLTLLIALFSFTLSFNALTDLAAKHGVSIPPLFPLVVEAGVVVFSLNALYRSLHNESAKMQWAMIILSSLLAGVFNVLHAAPDLISRVMSAMPSLFLLLSFETFLGQAKHIVKKKASVKSLTDLAQEIEDKRRELETMIADKKAELDQGRADLDRLNGQIERAQQRLQDIKTQTNREMSVNVQELNAARQAKIDQRRAAVLDMLRQGRIPEDIANELAVTSKTIRRDIAALNGKVQEVMTR